LYIYLPCPHSEHEKNPFQSKHSKHFHQRNQFTLCEISSNKVKLPKVGSKWCDSPTKVWNYSKVCSGRSCHFFLTLLYDIIFWMIIIHSLIVTKVSVEYNVLKNFVDSAIPDFNIMEWPCPCSLCWMYWLTYRNMLVCPVVRGSDWEKAFPCFLLSRDISSTSSSWIPGGQWWSDILFCYCNPGKRFEVWTTCSKQ
jgi:hypothetical protein